MKFDITVLGAGHAGVEASWIASKFDLKIALVTLPDVGIGEMPCNPSVGGVGKGQVVRELDALGGLMGKLADLAGIQYRTLNESKGFAVQSTRVQTDKKKYSKLAEKFISEKENISLIRTRVIKVAKNDSGLFCLFDSTGKILESKELIVTTGTFLNGILHTGGEISVGGVKDKQAAPSAKELFEIKIPDVVRFKTGTPARLDANSIDFSKFEIQVSDDTARNLHYLHSDYHRTSEQISCFLGHTNEKTLEIIRANREKSPLFNGQIKRIGPRYCPSIEDKAFRYPDRNIHHVFLEPDGLDTNSIYPSGISTSLPKEVQLEYIRSIKGLEQVEVLEYGYAVEYDAINSAQLKQTLEFPDEPGLYFAGQINGTSGCEEAAGQGIIAGANAALDLQDQLPLILDRNDSYIGVLIEDLVSNRRDEPYRLFTARSENRLYIREDNTLNRMLKYRIQLGIDSYYQNYIEEFEILNDLCKQTTYKATEKKQYFAEKNYGVIEENISMSELLKRPDLNPVKVLQEECKNFAVNFDYKVQYACAVTQKYEGYIMRAAQETGKWNKLARKKINWEDIIKCNNISYECRQRIKEIRPETFSQLQKIDGIRPATLAYVAGSLN